MILRIQGAKDSRTAGGVKGMELKTLEPWNPLTLFSSKKRGGPLKASPEF
jgi:hypothetical protein